MLEDTNSLEAAQLKYGFTGTFLATPVCQNGLLPHSQAARKNR